MEYGGREELKTKFNRFGKPIIGIIIGAAVGYAYYYYIGCSSGTCAITSKPLNSALYGALMGGLLITTFKKKENANRKFNKEQ